MPVLLSVLLLAVRIRLRLVVCPVLPVGLLPCVSLPVWHLGLAVRRLGIRRLPNALRVRWLLGCLLEALLLCLGRHLLGHLLGHLLEHLLVNLSWRLLLRGLICPRNRCRLR